MKELEAKWNQIVKLTEDDNIVLQGLRNSIFLDLKSKNSFINNVIFLLKIIQLLITPPKKVFLQNIKYIFIFYSNSPANLNNLAPIFEKFDRDEVAVFKHKLIDRSSFKNLKHCYCKNDIPYYTSYSQRMVLKRSFNLYHKLFYNFKNSGTDLFNIIRNNKIKYFYFILLILITKKASSNLLLRSNIKMIVSTSDHFPLEFSIFSIANYNNIPNFVVQHGILGISHFPFTSKTLIVWNSFVRDELLKKGANTDSVIIGGMISSDCLFRNNNDIIKNKENFKILILSDTQGQDIYPEIYSSYRKFLSNLIEINQNHVINVKLHPSEDPSFYKDYYNKIEVLNKNVGLMDALEENDIVLTIWSTAGLEAMIMNKPTFILLLDEQIKSYAWWPNKGGGKYVSTARELLICLKKVELENLLLQQNAFLSKYIPFQGEAANQTFNILNK